MELSEATLVIYIIWNIIVFTMYGIDKRKARLGQWRISEKVLILSAVLMGGLGALFGMMFFRHKTKKLKFRILIPLSLAINIFAVVFFYIKYK